MSKCLSFASEQKGLFCFKPNAIPTIMSQTYSQKGKRMNSKCGGEKKKNHLVFHLEEHLFLCVCTCPQMKDKWKWLVASGELNSECLCDNFGFNLDVTFAGHKWEAQDVSVHTVCVAHLCLYLYCMCVNMRTQLHREHVKHFGGITKCLISSSTKSLRCSLSNWSSCWHS